jgi:hypothetical protein
MLHFDRNRGIGTTGFAVADKSLDVAATGGELSQAMGETKGIRL